MVETDDHKSPYIAGNWSTYSEPTPAMLDGRAVPVNRPAGFKVAIEFMILATLLSVH
jgi:hypothetical protein